MMAPWLKAREPILLVGPEGCGKGALVDYCLRRLLNVQVSKFQPLTVSVFVHMCLIYSIGWDLHYLAC